MPRHFLSIADLSQAELLALLDRAAELKRARGTTAHPRPLADKSVAVLFDKASTRTRISFEVGIHELGGQPVTLISKDTQLGRGEPIEDTAHMLSRYVHAVVYRTFGHDRLEALAQHATIPVVNGLSDMFHPCQLLADLMTIRESVTPDLGGVHVAWVGDGNNMAHSWILAAAVAGFDLTLATPSDYQPDDGVLQQANALGANEIRVVDNVAEAVDGAKVVTTDVWASMGQEEEATKRRAAFAGFMVDDAVMKRAAADAIFLHCLPAHRGEEVSETVLEGAQSRVWDEAENRLHAQKALLEWLLSDPPARV